MSVLFQFSHKGVIKVSAVFRLHWENLYIQKKNVTDVKLKPQNQNILQPQNNIQNHQSSLLISGLVIPIKYR